MQSICAKRRANDRAVEAVRRGGCMQRQSQKENHRQMAKIAKTGHREKVMDTTTSTDCPKCNKPTRIVKRVKDRERGVPGGVYISCSACDFYEKL
jgi:DNA-directed RNA polymerase subunit M/transcription elongation factor TFIIS